jgi:GAF domain-containing protein
MSQSGAVLIMGSPADRNGNLTRDIDVKGIISAMCVPLITKAGMLGVIYAYSSNSLQRFRKEDLLFITSISSPTAVAIENALLHHKSRRAEIELRETGGQKRTTLH